jgi:hypothetical protein
MPAGAIECAARKPGPKAVNRQIDASIMWSDRVLRLPAAEMGPRLRLHPGWIGRAQVDTVAIDDSIEDYLYRIDSMLPCGLRALSSVRSHEGVDAGMPSMGVAVAASRSGTRWRQVVAAAWWSHPPRRGPYGGGKQQCFDPDRRRGE